MELWIRSQDKKRFIKTNDIAIEHTSTYVDWCIETKYGQDYILRDAWYIVINNVKVATYFSEERALEVLDEIQKLINNDGYIDEEEYNKSSGCYHQKNIKVYEMPSE